MESVYYFQDLKSVRKFQKHEISHPFSKPFLFGYFIASRRKLLELTQKIDDYW